MIKAFYGITLAAVCILASAATAVSATIVAAIERFIFPSPAQRRFVDPTPRSIFQTRRMGLC